MKNRETKGNSTSRTRITRENAQKYLLIIFWIHLVENICIEGYYEFDVLGSKAHHWLCYQYVLERRVSKDALFLFMRFLCVAHALSMRFYKPKAPQTRPSELHLQSTVDKLSSSYVLVFNVSTVNLGRVNMNFGSFSAFGHKILGRFSTRFPMPYQSNTNLIPINHIQMLDIINFIWK